MSGFCQLRFGRVTMLISVPLDTNRISWNSRLSVGSVREASLAQKAWRHRLASYSASHSVSLYLFILLLRLTPQGTLRGTLSTWSSLVEEGPSLPATPACMSVGQAQHARCPLCTGDLGDLGDRGYLLCSFGASAPLDLSRFGLQVSAIVCHKMPVEREETLCTEPLAAQIRDVALYSVQCRLQLEVLLTNTDMPLVEKSRSLF